jgi:AraC family transcriptional regulator
MEPRIEVLPEKKLVGKRLRMSFAANKTRELWQSLMPRKGEVKNRVDSALYSIEVYDDLSFFEKFDPEKDFEKWAAIEVSNFDSVPDEMETVSLPGGLYAVFTHRGTASEAPKTYRYIFQIWLPKSDFLLDDRPHFALMGEKYKNDDPNSEEEIWIPIKSEK